MAIPPDPQEELLPLAGPRSHCFGDWEEGEGKAVMPKGERLVLQVGSLAKGWARGSGKQCPRN